MKDIETIGENALSDALENAVTGRSAPSLEIDVERYQAYLDDPSLSREQKVEILTAFWSVITTFVEMGFGVHPVQQACGKPRTELEHAGFSESTEVRLDQCKQPDEQTPAP
ncbi:hypothetical protein [Pseudophaeobacter sp. C1-32P7]|uniref:hypothetical protein n=1 Tax=Pseudophaeobacter sp. C1-32P7 TaxID=3098142 RepID=UPI0034D63999